MQHRLTLFFKLDLITIFMDKFDMTDGSRKVFCQQFDMILETADDWCLSPGVVEILEKSFISEGVVSKISNEDNVCLCGIYDHAIGVFYNFTNKKDETIMFSDGKNFVHFDTTKDIQKPEYLDAYRKFIFSTKQAKSDKYSYCLSKWMNSLRGEDEVCK